MGSMIKLFRLFCIQLLICGAVHAQEEPPPPDLLEEPARGEYNFRHEFLRMLFILGLIITMVVATTWMFRRIGRGKMRTFNSNSAIQILERRAVSQKSFVYLLEVEGTKILVGDSQAGLHGLAVLTDTPSEPPSDRPEFSAILRDKLDKVTCKES